MREVGAGQFAARRLDQFSFARALEIFTASRGGSSTNTFGDFNDGVVQLLGGHSCSYQLWP